MALKRNIAANYVGRAYSAASIYLFTPFYVAILGIESYGLIAFYSIVLAIGALADIGLAATFSREAAREKDRGRLLDLLTTIERILVAATLVFALIVFLAADYAAHTWFNATGAITADQIARSLRLMALTVVPQLGVSLYVSGLLGLQRQGLGNGVQALYVTVRGGLVIPAIYAVPSIDLFLAWQLGAGLVLFVVARVALVRAMGFAPFSAGRWSLSALRPVIGFAVGILGLSILSGINTQLDRLVVSKLFSIEDLGYYTLASTLALVPVALVTPLMMALLPRLTELGSTGRSEEASRLYIGFVYVAAVLAALSAFGLAFFAPELLSLWLGRSDIPGTAVTLVRILSIGTLFFSLSQAPFNLGLAYGHNRTSIVTGFLTLIVTIPLLLIASARFGLIGAALPWVVLNAAAFLALSWNIHRHFYHGVSSPMGWTIPPVLVSALAMGASRFVADRLGTGPWGSCMIAAAIGAGALLLLLGVRKKLEPVLSGP